MKRSLKKQLAVDNGMLSCANNAAEVVANCDRQIQSRIFPLRGMQVMLDRDLAELYGVETRVLNQAVKRNIERFPSSFMFRLTKDE